jgi:hypothetical protein
LAPQILLVGRKVPSLAGIAAAAYENGEKFQELTDVGDKCEFVDRERILGGGGQVITRL